MAVGGIHHHHIGASLYQCRDSVLGISTGANTGANTKLALGIFAGHGEGLSFNDILHRNHAGKFIGFVDQQNFFNLVVVQQGHHLLEICAFQRGNQSSAGGHHIFYQRVHAAFKTQVSAGDNASKLACLDHRHP